MFGIVAKIILDQRVSLHPRHESVELLVPEDARARGHLQLAVFSEPDARVRAVHFFLDMAQAAQNTFYFFLSEAMNLPVAAEAVHRDVFGHVCGELVYWACL